MDEVVCSSCDGNRLKKESLHFKIDHKNISDLAKLDINELAEWFENLEAKLSERQLIIAVEILKEIKTRIQFLLDVGLDYLTLDRTSKSLSGGEAQRCAMLALMAQEARIWLLDEPANHLDPKIQQDVYQGLISQWNTGTTMVLITHNINLLLRSVPDKYKHKVRILGIHEGYIQFDAALSSPELAAKISKLYQLPVETISVFGFSQLIFGQGEK